MGLYNDYFVEERKNFFLSLYFMLTVLTIYGHASPYLDLQLLHHKHKRLHVDVRMTCGLIAIH